MALGFVEVERWKKDFDRDVMCIYRERDSTSQLRRCPSRFTSEGHVVNKQHIGSCSMFQRMPGLSGGRSGFSGFQAIRIEHLKQIQCLSLYLLLTRTQRRHSTVSIDCM